jgi:hypothetical protein
VTGSRQRRLWVTVGIMGALLVAELAARALGSRLPDPERWKLPAVEVLLERMERVPPGGVVLLGASQTGTDIAPVALAEQAESVETAFNAWLVGAGMRTVERWAREFVVPRLAPSVVVIGVTSRELNDNLPEEAFQKYRTSRAVVENLDSPSWLERVRMAAERWSAVVRHRERFRSPVGTLRAVLAGDRSQEPDDPGVGPGGMLVDRIDWDLRVDPAHVERERRALAGYRVGDRQTEAMVRLVSELRRRGVDVVLVDLPVYEPVTVPMHPRGAVDVARYRQALRSVAARLGVPLLDARRAGPWEREHFADPEHLNGRGARRLTAWLAAELDRLAGLAPPEAGGGEQPGTSLPGEAGPTTPPPATTAGGGALFGVYKGSEPDSVGAFERWLGRKVDIVVVHLDRTSDWSRWAAPVWLERFSDRSLAVLTPPFPDRARATLGAAARGDYDAHYAALARNLVAHGHGRARITLAHEPNGDWYPWSATRGRHGAYVAAWRRIVDIFRAQPGAAFRFDWVVARGAQAMADPTLAYPCDEYVDAVGMDVYDDDWEFTPARGGEWQRLRWAKFCTMPFGAYHDSKWYDGDHLITGGNFPRAAALVRSLYGNEGGERPSGLGPPEVCARQGHAGVEVVPG